MELWGQNCHAKIRVLRPSQNFARMTNTISSIRAVNIRMTTPGGGVYSTSVPYFIRNKGIRKSQILTTLNFVTKVLHFMLHFILVEAKCFATMQRAIKKRNTTMQTGSSEDEIHKTVSSFINCRQSARSAVMPRHLTQDQPTTLYCMRTKQRTAMQLEYIAGWLHWGKNEE